MPPESTRNHRRQTHPQNGATSSAQYHPTTYIMADVARRCADEWLHLADALENRTDQKG
jgi:hypothetical protein